MDYKGKLVSWNRSTLPPYFGVITDQEYRPSLGALPPWLFFKVDWVGETSPEFDKDAWQRCDHVNIVDGYAEIGRIHSAMIAQSEYEAESE